MERALQIFLKLGLVEVLDSGTFYTVSYTHLDVYKRQNPNYDFSTLFENVVWGNTQMFFPSSLVMIGSWLIDRESTHDTLKNIMTSPVSLPEMLGAKLFWVGIFAVLLGIYSVGVTSVSYTHLILCMRWCRPATVIH